MNKISTPVPHPEYPEDYAKTLMTTMQNQQLFAKEVNYFCIYEISLNILFFLINFQLIFFRVLDFPGNVQVAWTHCTIFL